MELERRLAWHGMLLFLLGLLMGIAVAAAANPRLALSAHVGAVLNGVFLLALGGVWSKVVLAPRVATATYWITVAGSYVSCVALFLAGVFGTVRSTPLNGAGHAGTEWQEMLVSAGLNLGGAALLLACVPLLWGLRRRGGG